MAKHIVSPGRPAAGAPAGRRPQRAPSGLPAGSQRARLEAPLPGGRKIFEPFLELLGPETDSSLCDRGTCDQPCDRGTMYTSYSLQSDR